ncbi:MAG: hypothetical protein MUC38_08820 [Cyclobacteriaceae bacterium]|nr:hypothetical protein [Cyclobacteriaceae bacterium]
MAQTILIPVADGADGKPLADYLTLFDQAEDRKLAAFFVDDMVGPAALSLRQHWQREQVREALEREAQGASVDFHFLSAAEGHLDWALQTQLADLLVLVGVGGREAAANARLDHVRCPVLLSAPWPFCYEHVFIVFDATASLLTAFKSFLLFFGTTARHRPVTVLSFVASSTRAIQLEKFFIHHVRSQFSNIGIMPVHPEEWADVLAHEVQRAPRALIVLGQRAHHFLPPTPRLPKLPPSASLYFSNEQHASPR